MAGQALLEVSCLLDLPERSPVVLGGELFSRFRLPLSTATPAARSSKLEGSGTVDPANVNAALNGP